MLHPAARTGHASHVAECIHGHGLTVVTGKNTKTLVLLASYYLKFVDIDFNQNWLKNNASACCVT
jgi:hypothetical protein